MAVNIVVPEVGESIVDARVAKWLRKEGESVAAGDALVELETDKIDLEVAAPTGGVIKSIAHQDGADVKVGDVLGVIDESAKGASAAPAPAAKAKEEPKEEPKEQPKAAETDTTKTRATPTARKAAEEKDVDLSKVKGSGDAGRVMRRDVEAVSAEAPKAPSLAEAASAKAPAAKADLKTRPAPERRPSGDRTEERVRMSKRRATIAKRLLEVQSTAAMLTTFNEVDMSGIQAVRARHKEAFKERHGISLGMTLGFMLLCLSAVWWIFKTGYRLKT